MFHGKVVEPCEIFAFGVGLDDDSWQLQTVQMPAQMLDDDLLVHFGCKPAGKHDLCGIEEDDCRGDKLVHDRHRVLYVAEGRRLAALVEIEGVVRKFAGKVRGAA